jgi:hypothetical protein
VSTAPEDLAVDATAAVAAPRPEDDAPERHLRAVPPRRRRQPRLGLWIGSVVTAVSLFLLVAFNVFMVQGQFELDRVAQDHALEQKQYETLRDKVATLSAPDQIVRRARALGLVDSANVSYLSAPAAGVTKPPRDDTATTQHETYGDAKPHLAASP